VAIVKGFGRHPTIKPFLMVTKTHFQSPFDNQAFLDGNQNQFFMAICKSTEMFM
jgi:hypothetical protein